MQHSVGSFGGRISFISAFPPSVDKKSLDYYVSTEGDKPERAGGETFQSKVIVVFRVIESSWGKKNNNKKKSFLALLCSCRFNQVRLLPTWHTKSGQLLARAEFPQIIKLQLKAPGGGEGGGKQNHSNCILCQILLQHNAFTRGPAQSF